MGARAPTWSGLIDVMFRGDFVNNSTLSCGRCISYDVRCEFGLHGFVTSNIPRISYEIHLTKYCQSTVPVEFNYLSYYTDELLPTKDRPRHNE
jgi:hypothetical protein